MSSASRSKSSIDGRVGLRAPVLVDEDEVVREVQLVAVLQVGDDAVQVLQRHLPHDHAVLVLVHDLADAAQAVVDRLPVLVVRARRTGLVAQERVLGDPRDRVQAQAVDAAIHPEADHVVHRALDLGVVPVEVGLLGHEAVQVVLLRGLVERPRGAAGLEHRLPVVGLVAPDVPVALGVLPVSGTQEPRVLVGAVVRDPVQDQLIPRACVSATSSSRSAACRTPGRCRSSRPRRTRSRPSAR